MNRRSFLRTLGAALAAGFAKVDVASGHLAAWDMGAGQSWTAITYRGIPIVADRYCPVNTVLFVSNPDYIARLMAPPYERQRLVAGEWLDEVAREPTSSS